MNIGDRLRMLSWLLTRVETEPSGSSMLVTYIPSRLSRITLPAGVVWVVAGGLVAFGPGQEVHLLWKIVIVGFTCAGLVVMAVPAVLSLRATILIGDGTVRTDQMRLFGLLKQRWTEKLTAYRGLHACLHTWQEERRLEETATQREEIETIRHQQGLLLLEHTSVPSRTLLLAKSDRPIKADVAMGMAEKLGVPLRWTH